METLNNVLSWLDKLQGLPAVALVFFSGIVVGYGLKFLKRFPNDGIPVVVILWGAVAMLFIADPRPNTMAARIWTCRNIFIGLIIGLAAWLTHNLLLSRLEDFIGTKFGLTGTAFFMKKANGQVVVDNPTPPVPKP